jgi:hypothetical protein
MLLDPQGRVLASSGFDDSDSVGQPLELPNLPIALAGKNSVWIDYSQKAFKVRLLRFWRR